MPTPSLPTIGDNPDPRQILDYVVKLQRDLEWLLANLDTLNVRRLNAEVIEANTITADKMDVDKLSAISADMGTITAGLMQAVTMIASQIYGSYIATNMGTYPFAEMSNTNNTFVVHLNANQRATMRPGVGGLGNPALVFTDLGGALEAIIQTFTSFENSLLITCNGDIRFSSGTSRIRFPSWSAIQNISTGHTLQQDLDSIAAMAAAALAAATSGP